jgi:hypothetical protein
VDDILKGDGDLNFLGRHPDTGRALGNDEPVLVHWYTIQDILGRFRQRIQSGQQDRKNVVDGYEQTIQGLKADVKRYQEFIQTLRNRFMMLASGDVNHVNWFADFTKWMRDTGSHVFWDESADKDNRDRFNKMVDDLVYWRDGLVKSLATATATATGPKQPPMLPPSHGPATIQIPGVPNLESELRAVCQERFWSLLLQSYMGEKEYLPNFPILIQLRTIIHQGRNTALISRIRAVLAVYNSYHGLKQTQTQMASSPSSSEIQTVKEDVRTLISQLESELEGHMERQDRTTRNLGQLWTPLRNSDHIKQYFNGLKAPQNTLLWSFKAHDVNDVFLPISQLR